MHTKPTRVIGLACCSIPTKVCCGAIAGIRLLYPTIVLSDGVQTLERAIRFPVMVRTRIVQSLRGNMMRILVASRMRRQR
jgi:hypothetical protein